MHKRKHEMQIKNGGSTKKRQRQDARLPDRGKERACFEAELRARERM